ncbi:MAG: hypothetical protein ACM3ML_36965 [Micromonosporaceae bacterium]
MASRSARANRLSSSLLRSAGANHATSLISSSSARDTADDLSVADGGDVSGPAAVRVGDLIVRATEHVEQPDQADVDTDLLAGLP